MSVYDEFVANDHDVMEIIKNYETLTGDGVIGDCFLRSCAESVKDYNRNTGDIMADIAFCAYRKFAMKYIDAVYYK